MRDIHQNKSPTAVNNREVPQAVTCILILNSNIMKYRVDAYRNNAVIKRGEILLDSIDEAIKLAKNVATHYHCYTRIARVQA